MGSYLSYFGFLILLLAGFYYLNDAGMNRDKSLNERLDKLALDLKHHKLREKSVNQMAVANSSAILDLDGRTTALSELRQMQSSEKTADGELLDTRISKQKEDELNLDNEVDRRKFLDKEMTRQFNRMQADPQQTEQLQQVFGNYWNQFVEIQNSQRSTKGNERVALWQAYCLEILPIVTERQAELIQCNEGVIMNPG